MQSEPLVSDGQFAVPCIGIVKSTLASGRAGAAGGVPFRLPSIVTMVEPAIVESATLVAVIFTLAEGGTAEGALKSPLLESVPHAAPLQPAPVKLHVTAVFVVPSTEALNCWLAPTPTDGLTGETATEI